MNFKLSRTFPLLFVALLCQCGAPQPPVCVRVPVASRAPAISLITSAKENWKILANPNRRAAWPAARASYNAAIAKLFDQLRVGPGTWDSRAALIGTRIATPDEQLVNLATLDALFPVTDVSTRSVANHRTTEGLGVPLVGWKKTSPVGSKRAPYLLPTGLPYNITATLAFDRSGTPLWQFSKRWLNNDIAVGSTSHTLAADWTATNAFFWKMSDLDDLSIRNVILPDRFSQETGLYFLQPYDPNKIPVVFVHGLISSPDAFKNVINELAPDPWFRERYQVWLFNYPTGVPWIYSSMKFREQIRSACAYARTKGSDENLNRMVLVTHSMGGLVARSSVTNPGTALYDARYNKPIDQLRVTPRTRKLIGNSTLYQPLTEPKRVVFMAVPHQGSPMATLRITTWISRLIQLPKTLTVDLLDATLQSVSDVVQGNGETPQLPTSISSLSPRNPNNMALSRMPLPPGITFHSIIGKTGWRDTLNSSDGVVPYWSSHVEPVASELVVSSNHSVPNNPEAAKEVERILELHLQN